MAESKNCQNCDNFIIKPGGGYMLINSHCSRFCYEIEQQGLDKVTKKILTNCVLCGNRTELTRQRPNAWLCGHSCNIRKSKIFGRKSNKKYLVLHYLQFHGRNTADTIATALAKVHTRYTFTHMVVSQMLRDFVARGKVIRHPNPISNQLGSTYEIEHDLPLENLAYPSSLTSKD
tara:strand:- start:2402 stop:2926 length:525 start_codon:yes stop_codon:yes gene_type:complete